METPASKDLLSEKLFEISKKKQTPSSQKTILLIDDDMAYLKQLNSYLKDSYRAVMVNSGKLALNFLKKNTPDLILLDYQMPQYTGAQLMKEIETEYPQKKVPVILLTGTISEDTLKEFDSYVPVACLKKPVVREVLLEEIKKIL